MKTLKLKGSEVTLRNLTPHALVFKTDEGMRSVEGVTECVRVLWAAPVGNSWMKLVTKPALTNLPPKTEGVVIVVSTFCAQTAAAFLSDRDDIVAPITEEVKGRKIVIGLQKFVA